MKYDLFVKQSLETIKQERYLEPLLANLSALIFTLTDISWAGFYLVKGEKLILQCFCGLPACSEIPLGKGVCGKVAQEAKALSVSNVHDFCGHIACDSRTNSEAVFPIFKEGKVFGVLDVDSIRFNRFDEEIFSALAQIAQALSEKLPAFEQQN